MGVKILRTLHSLSTTEYFIPFLMRYVKQTNKKAYKSVQARSSEQAKIMTGAIEDHDIYNNGINL